MGLESQESQRRHLRFTPDRGAGLKLDLDISHEEDFKPSVGAVLRDESFQGCGAVGFRNPRIQPGIVCRAQAGNLHVMWARVVWVRSLDDAKIAFGLEYLE